MTGLEGKRFAVAGGAGFVGSGISKALLEAGANVLILSCDEPCIARFQESSLQKYQGQADFLHARLGTEKGDSALREKLEDGLPWNGAVASLGAWASSGPLLDLHPQELPDLILANIVSHIRFMQIVVPHLADDAQYIQLNGVGMDKPIPNYGIMSVFDAATHMLKNVVAEETLDRPVTIYTLALQNHVKAQEQGGESSFSPELVGGRIVELLGSDRYSHRHGRTLRWAHDWQVSP